jgi:hypothetical protein
MDEPQYPSKNPQGFAQAELAEEGVKVIISLNLSHVFVTI